MVSDSNPQIAAGGGLSDHWDPSNPRDLETIRSAMKRYPKRFRTMDESAQAEVVEMARLSARCARQAAEAATEPRDIVDAGRLAALSATVGAGLVKIQQADEHHADNLAKPAAGTTVNVGVQVGGTSDASIVQFFVEQGIPDKMPPALLERYKAGEFE